MSEEKLLTLFQKLNIETGKVSPNVIKGWFDTDCKDLLEWICSNVTEDCYISAQEEAEYAQIDSLTDEQLSEQVKLIERKHPGLFDTQSNLFDIEIAKDTIEILEEQSQDYDHQIQANQKLHQNLLAELSKVTEEEIKSQLEEESALEKCTVLSNKLDKINAQTYEQITKYSFYLSYYEFAEFPVFINNVDPTEFEEKFLCASNCLNSITKIESDLLEISDAKYVTDSLSELENRIFNSKIGHLALQMEISALNSILKFLETYDVNSCSFYLDVDSSDLAIKNSKELQSCMLRELEEKIALQVAGQSVNQFTLKCLKNEAEFFQLKLNYLHKFKGNLTKILQLFVILHTLYFQEKVDIHSSSQFFKNVHKYINKDLKLSKFRKGAMLNVISHYEDFCSLPIEKKIKLVGDFSSIAFKNNGGSFRQTVEKTTLLRSNAEKAQKQMWLSLKTDLNAVTKLCSSIHILQDFLICGPTSQLVIVPIPLQSVFFEIDKNVQDQSLCVKFLMQAAQEPKDILAKDKWLRHQDTLWTLFMTDSKKMLSFLEQLKFHENCPEEKGHQKS